MTQITKLQTPKWIPGENALGTISVYLANQFFGYRLVLQTYSPTPRRDLDCLQPKESTDFMTNILLSLIRLLNWTCVDLYRSIDPCIYLDHSILICEHINKQNEMWVDAFLYILVKIHRSRSKQSSAFDPSLFWYRSSFFFGHVFGHGEHDQETMCCHFLQYMCSTALCPSVLLQNASLSVFNILNGFLTKNLHGRISSNKGIISQKCDNF